jgi:predicted O-linked N-acetylglucosamine transferase (SPINDLY family)
MDPRLASAARLQQQGNYPAAEQVYRQLLLTQPRDVGVLMLLGLLLHETGRNQESVETLRRALAIQPHRAEVHQTLINPLLALGRLPEAIAGARELVRLRPLVAGAHLTAANLHLQAGDAAGALPFAKRAAELQPKSAEHQSFLARVWFELGLWQHNQKQNSEALQSYTRAIEIDANHIGATHNLGALYLQHKQYKEAIPLLKKAVELNPGDPKFRNNLGTALDGLFHFEQAVQQYELAIRLKPDFCDAMINLALTFITVGEHTEAEKLLRRSMTLAPDYWLGHSTLLFSMVQRSGVTESEVFAEHQSWAQKHAAPLSHDALPPRVLDADKPRLKIGYVSADLREHSVRYFIEPLLANHDHSAVEVFCYFNETHHDQVTQRLKGFADTWRDVADLDDAQLAALIRADAIDILVDLSGHTGGTRLLSFARSPAPVQVTYLGYPATTGMRAIQYRLTDAVADPGDTESFCTEELVRLPDAFFVFNGDTQLTYDPQLPANKNGHLTFGSLNNFGKIGPPVLECWAAILQQASNARLILRSGVVEYSRMNHRITEFFAQRGIGQERLELRGAHGVADYYQQLQRMDVALDPFPFNGHTTTCQSLWAGVPVLTLAGNSFRQRVGASVLTQLGLTDFITHSPEQYVAKAVSLAGDWERLAELRPILRDRMMQSPLCDGVGFARAVERAFRQMWRKEAAPRPSKGI